jgi:hypothetical protein
MAPVARVPRIPAEPDAVQLARQTQERLQTKLEAVERDHVVYRPSTALLLDPSCVTPNTHVIPSGLQLDLNHRQTIVRE